MRRFLPLSRSLRGRLGLAAVLLVLAVTPAVLTRFAPYANPVVAPRPVATALETELRRSGAPPAVVAFYQARNYEPLWVRAPAGWRTFVSSYALRPEAMQMASMASHPPPGVLPASKALAEAIAAAGTEEPLDLAKAELALTLSLDTYVHALRRVPAGAQLAFIDQDLKVPVDTLEVLTRAAAAPSLARLLTSLHQVNPVYNALNDGLAVYRGEWSHLPQVQLTPGPTLEFGVAGVRVQMLRTRLGVGSAGDARFDEALEQAVRRFQTVHGLEPSGKADAATVAALNAGAASYERLILANLERARALPPLTTNRFILVNVAAGRLWLYEGGEVRSSMRVVVGTQQEQTPMMAGLIRYAVFNPYWHIPEDMVRDLIAPRIVNQGVGYFHHANLTALSDWEEGAMEVDPNNVDWAGVAAGRVSLPVRQRPGGDNMMGKVKFMLPNELGIYLHDTPDKSAFSQSRRLMSAGCVRLEHAPELVTWLLGGLTPISTAVDQRVDLDRPVPVYITYLTAAPMAPEVGAEPSAGGVAFYPDVYGRDPALLAALSSDG